MNSEMKVLELKGLLSSLFFMVMLVSCQTPNLDTHTMSLRFGSVDRVEEFESNFVTSRNIDIWLPEDYKKSNKYSVVYMHDGQMLFDSTQTWNGQEWGIDELYGQLIQDKKIHNAIVVGIWNTSLRRSEYLPQKAFDLLSREDQDSMLSSTDSGGRPLFEKEIISDSYLRFIVEELKPYIDSMYSTRTTREHTFIMGSSMGGLISWYALCEFPQVFSAAACLSTHWTGTYDPNDNPFPNACLSYLEKNLPPKGDIRIYFDYGTETLDSIYEPFQLQVDALMRERELGEHWITKKFEGANHSERAWMNRLEEPVMFLLKK